MKSATLKETVVENNLTYSTDSSEAQTASRLFVGLVRERRAWILGVLFLGMVVILEPLVILRLTSHPEKAIILDPSGTYYISPILPLETATDIQKNIGMLATQCLFSQNPLGYDLEPVIEDLFIGPAKEKILKNWEEQQVVFKEKNLHQKPEIFSTTVLKVEGNYILVKVEGQVIRTGGVEGATIAHSQNMRVQFVLNKNPNLIKSGNYPFTVCDFKYILL